MKKKISVSTVIFIVHLLLCVLISFDWPFLVGDYLGFGLTLLIVWGASLPIITACISIVDVIVKTKGQERLSLLEIATAAVGSIVLLIYAASAGGLLKLLALEFIYALVFVGTLFILGCRCYRRIKRK